jgi:hypothetical protein
MNEALEAVLTLDSLNLVPEAEAIVDRVLSASAVQHRRNLMLLA